MTTPERQIEASINLLERSAGNLPSVTDNILYGLLRQILSNQVTLLQAAKVGYSWKDD